MGAVPERIALSSGERPLKIVRRRSARRFILRLDDEDDAVILTLPRYASSAAALRFLDDNRGWIEQRLDELPPRIVFADGVEIPILGVPHVIRHRAESRGHGAAWLEPGTLCVAGDPRHLARRVTDFLRERARHELGLRARAMAMSIGRRVLRISVRDTRTRWGSCAHDGALCFSWRLILAPAAVVDYVVAHEIAHLKHMNHGARFWRAVEDLAPGSGAQRSWLRRNRARLLRFG
ncbi:MAG: M48 family metallopeptidase [Alphaproteobacteria bacterium]|nr:M48 family metallopeptidase [Alphaproteobacteria bacterium]MDE1931591.1 M48 family metallopeptidase [Alphaproteobacteria bacterium]